MTTSHQRRCNVITLHRCWCDVALKSYACWVCFLFLTFINVKLDPMAHVWTVVIKIKPKLIWHSGLTCSKLTMSLVNVSLKLLSFNMAYTLMFLLKKMWAAFAFAVKIPVNYKCRCCTYKNSYILTTNETVKLTMLWTTWPWF